MIDVVRLETHPFLTGLDGLALQRLAAVTTEESAPAGRHLFKTNEPADALRLIEVGTVAVELHDPHRGNLRIETLHDGDVLGWSAIVPPNRWRFDARTISATDLLVVDGAALHELLHTDGFPGTQLYARLLGVVVDRLQNTRVRLLDLFGEHSA